MADRYWVGGSGTWDATTTTNWSTSSGGGGGASAPTSADNVIFDVNSNIGTGAFTVTITAATCLNFTASGLDGVMTVDSGATNTPLDVYGSMTLPATNLSWLPTIGITLTFRGTTSNTLTTNGVTVNTTTLTLDAVGGTLSLGSALTLNSTRQLIITNGTFTTTASNYSISVGTLNSTNSNVRSISLNASTVTLSGTTALTFATATNLTFSAGTSAITCSGASSTFNGGAQTFYNVTFSNVGAGTTNITGVNTFNDLTQTSRSADGLRTIVFSVSQTVNGTLTIGTTNTSIRRITVYGTNSIGLGVGTPITLTVATIATLADVDFRDITAAGASGTWSGTRLGNGGGNSNITFAAGVNKYWNLAAGGNWSATAWALTSGGAVDANNFPLAQDTVIIEDTGLTAGNTITINSGWWLPTINASTRTTAFTLASGTQTPTFFGSYTIPSVATITGTGICYFGAINSVQDITTNGVALTFPITIIGSTTNTVRLIGNLTMSNAVALTQGTLDLNNNVLSSTTFTAGSGTNTLAFGTGNITLTGVGTIFTGSTTTTVTGTPQVICTNSSATARTITPGVVTEANSISFRITAGTGSFAITTTHAVRDLDFTDGVNPTGFAGNMAASNNIIYGNFKASTGMTFSPTALTINFAATSGTKTINSAGVIIDRAISFIGAGGTFQLQAALTSGATRTCNLTAGTLDLASYTLTTGIFSSTNSNVRTLAFGTGKIVLTSTTGTVLSMSTVTNFTYTGTSRIEVTASGAGRTITPPSTSAVESNALNIYVTTGSDTVTVSGAARFLTFDLTGFAGTLTYASNSRYFGDLVFSSGMTLGSISGTFTFAKTSGTQTITSAGKTIDQSVVADAPGAIVSLQDALTLGSTRTLTLTNGTLTTNGYALTAGLFSSSNTNTRVLNLGASTVTISGTGTTWNITDPTNMTLNAGTSSLVFTGTSDNVAFVGGGLTYYNLTTPDSLYSFFNSSVFVCNNYTATNTSLGEKGIRFFAGSSTVNGTFSVNGSAANSRIILYGSTVGTQSTISASSVALSNLDFRDINASGASIPWTGSSFGDCGGNSNITFSASKTVYWNLPSGGSWTDTAWATSSGGAPAVANQPLPQDTAIFDNTGISASSVVTFDSLIQTGALNCSSLTNAIDFSITGTYGSPIFYGDITLSSAVTISAPTTTNIAFAKRGSPQIITSAGATITCSINSLATSAKLADNFTTTENFNLSSFEVDLNGKTLTCVIFSSSSTTTRAIAFNGGNIAVTGNNATVWSCADLTNFSYTGTPTVNFTYSGSTGTRTINNGTTAGGTEANAVDFNSTAGTDTFTFATASSVRNLNYTGFSGLGTTISSGFIYGNLTLSATQTIASSLQITTFAATSGTKTITTNGVTIDRPLTFDGIGGTWSLQDALTVGATRTLQLYAGTLTTNGYAVSVGKFGNAGSEATGNRTLNLGASSMNILGTTGGNASWQIEDGSFSFAINAGTSTIFMSEPFTGTSTQNFIGSGKTYYNVVYSGGQTGGFYGNNTFNSISNTTQPLTLVFEAGSTQTVNNFNLSGTAGNLVTMTSTTPGTRYNLAKNTGSKVLVSYVSITDSAATPAGYWFSPTSQGNVDGGNNTGWNFGATGATSGFLALF